jgi:hypothetical protein
MYRKSGRNYAQPFQRRRPDLNRKTISGTGSQGQRSTRLSHDGMTTISMEKSMVYKFSYV